jgi:hypothetical protein
MKAKLGIFLLLFSAGLAKADTLQVTFDTSFPFNTIPIETVSGSFLWDTSTQTFSNISISSSGSYSFQPEIDYAEFAQPGNFYNYPAGSILFLVFPGSNTGTGFQFDYLEHGGLDIPPSGPGTYTGEFFLVGGGLGVTPAMTGEVIVTEAVVATPEPPVLWLLALGTIGLFIAWARRRSSDSTPIASMAVFDSI